VRAIAALAQRRGLIHTGLDDLASALRQQNPRCLFGAGEADGDNRAHTALERALKSPLMDRGRLLGDASSVLVNIAGGPSMTLNEVQILMEELNRHIGEKTRILFGAAVDPKLGNRLSVTLLTSMEAGARGSSETATIFEAPPKAAPRRQAASEAPAAPAATQKEPPAPAVSYVDVEATFDKPAAPERAPEEPAETPPAPARAGAAKPNAAAAKAARQAESIAAAEARAAKQEQMQFEPVTRGRFEKSEPTIVDGQDLDVPTFLRRNLKMR
jgi:cell division protein FtsZ